MAYFNYFIKCFIRIFTRKYFKHLLLFLIIFIGFILFDKSNVYAFSSSTYGNYNGFSTEQISFINQQILSYKGDYDSFYCRYFYNEPTNEDFISILFYNFNDFGRLYKIDANDPTHYPRRIFTVFSEFTPTANLPYVVLNFPLSLDNISVSSATRIYQGTSSLIAGDNSSYGCYTNRVIYNNNSFNSVFLPNDNTPLPIIPYFITTDNELQTFNFDYFQINGGNTKYKTTFMGQDYYARFNLKYIYNGVTTNIEILDDYISYNSTDNTWQINIPYNALTNSVVVRNGGVFRYVFEYDLQYETGYDISTNELTYNLTTEQEQNINDESSKQLQSQILDATQQTNESINNLNSSINNLDTSINDSNISDINNDSLPQDNTQDITSNGVNGIFQSIYNAFCVGQPQDIVFPFPFTDKNITLSSSYVRNALEGSGASFIITLIQAFWWYIISRFIIKDVMDKINKIKSGNIENIEKTNIRGDML